MIKLKNRYTCNTWHQLHEVGWNCSGWREVWTNTEHWTRRNVTQIRMIYCQLRPWPVSTECWVRIKLWHSASLVIVTGKQSECRLEHLYNQNLRGNWDGNYLMMFDWGYLRLDPGSWQTDIGDTRPGCHLLLFACSYFHSLIVLLVVHNNPYYPWLPIPESSYVILGSFRGREHLGVILGKLEVVILEGHGRS